MHSSRSNGSVESKKRLETQLPKSIMWAATEWVNAGWLVGSVCVISSRDYLNTVFQTSVNRALLPVWDSYSDMKLYFQCPEQFYWAYIHF